MSGFLDAINGSPSSLGAPKGRVSKDAGWLCSSFGSIFAQPRSAFRRFDNRRSPVSAGWAPTPNQSAHCSN
jgi:hypothetical protein